MKGVSFHEWKEHRDGSLKKKSTSSSSTTTSSRSGRSGRSGKPGGSKRSKKVTNACVQCERKIAVNEDALFVEEDVGRMFCSEKCIVSFFEADIESLEKEYYTLISKSEITDEVKERFGHHRWSTLENPQEVWVEKTIKGDLRYTLISEFQEGSLTLWGVCITLFLRGEPSFLFLAFLTGDSNLVEHYRKGEPVNSLPKGEANQPKLDRLAESWTSDETYRASVNKARDKDDIPIDEYSSYDSCIDETLETPDEVWQIQRNSMVVREVTESEMAESMASDETSEAGEKTGGGGSSSGGSGFQTGLIYHFIKHYSHGAGFWYILIAKETDDEDQLEILDCFPTRDPDLVDKYRVGSLEIGSRDTGSGSSLVH